MKFIFTDNIPDKIYIYIHHVGQFLQVSIRNSVTELFTLEGATYLSLELLISQSLSTPSNPCIENSTAYDNCIFDQYISKITGANSCLLPFLPQQFSPTTAYCNNYNLAMRSLDYFQNISSSCPASCILAFSDLTLQLEDQYLTNTLTRSMFPSSIERKILVLLLPKDANIIESRHDYTLFSALAEFLGIAGLFFGISAHGFAHSILTIFSTLSKLTGLNSSMCKYIKTFFLVILGLTSSALVIWILHFFIGKYITYPVRSQVSLVPGIPPMSMALCRSKYMTSFNYQNKSFQSVTEDTLFWQDGLNLHKKITYMAIMNYNGEWKTIWDRVQSETDSFSTIIFPLNNQTIQFCDIFDMQKYQNLAKVKNTNYFLGAATRRILSRKSELENFVHYPLRWYII
jgi:Amiloride-sensitive sodium channel